MVGVEAEVGLAGGGEVGLDEGRGRGVSAELSLEDGGGQAIPW